jgi:hypothetical protein
MLVPDETLREISIRNKRKLDFEFTGHITYHAILVSNDDNNNDSGCNESEEKRKETRTKKHAATNNGMHKLNNNDSRSSVSIGKMQQQ